MKLFSILFGLAMAAVLGGCATVSQEPIAVVSPAQAERPAAKPPQGVLQRGTVISGDFYSLRENGLDTLEQYQRRPDIRYTVERVDATGVWASQKPVLRCATECLVMRDLAQLGFPTRAGWKLVAPIQFRYTEGDADMNRTIIEASVGPEEDHPLEGGGSVRVVPVTVVGTVVMRIYETVYPPFRFEQVYWYAPTIGFTMAWSYRSANPSNRKRGDYDHAHRRFRATRVEFPSSTTSAVVPTVAPAPVTTTIAPAAPAKQ